MGKQEAWEVQGALGPEASRYREFHPTREIHISKMELD